MDKIVLKCTLQVIPDSSGAYFEQRFLLGYVTDKYPYDSEELKKYIFILNLEKA